MEVDVLFPISYNGNKYAVVFVDYRIHGLISAYAYFQKVPVRYRPNAASGGWGYGRDLVHCRDREKAALTSH